MARAFCSSNYGALAAGFILDNNEDENNTTSAKAQQQQSSPIKYKTAEQDEVISINSKDDSSIMDQVAMIDQAVAIQSFKQQQKKKNESEVGMIQTKKRLQHMIQSMPKQVIIQHQINTTLHMLTTALLLMNK